MKKQFQNPILSGFHPDPSLCRVGDDYYLVNSTFAYFPAIPIYHSKDLVHWEQVGNVLDREEQVPLSGCGHSRGIFAPTIRYCDGTFYLVTTNVSDANGNFIVTAKKPEGPWSNPVPLHAEGIDPSLFFDDDGKCYYCGTKPRREGARYYGDNEVYIQELDLGDMTLVGESRAAWHGALRNAVWPEGPHIFKKDGWYYLMIAEGGTGYEHAVTVARSKSLSEPFVGYPCNPILTHRHLGRGYPIINVGHPDVVVTANGEWWMVILASRPYGGYYCNMGRETFLVPFTWEDGWPVVNPGVGLVEESLPAPNLPSPPVATPCNGSKDVTEDFDGDALPPSFLYLRNPNLQNYSLTENPGHLRLRLAPERVTEEASPSFVCRRQTTKSYSVETALSFNPQADCECAGLVLLQSNEYHYQFILTNRDGHPYLAVVRVKGGEVDEVKGRRIDAVPNQLYLKITQRVQDLTFSYRLESRGSYETLADSVDARILSTDVAGGFVGTCLGLYASSNGEASSNHADFDYLAYRGDD